MFLIGSIVPSLLVDRLGRRRPMMWGSFGLGLSMMLISILLSFKGSSVEKSTASASVAFFFTVSLSKTTHNNRGRQLLMFVSFSTCLYSEARSIAFHGSMFQKSYPFMQGQKEQLLVSHLTGFG